MTLSVLVPYRPDGGHRDRAWAWVEKRWRNLFPEAELLVGGDDGGSSPAQFNHPLAINRLAALASGDVYVIADADTAPHYGFIEHAWGCVAPDGLADAWVLPTEYRKLTAEATLAVLEFFPHWSNLDELETEWIGESVSWSGTVVVRADAFHAVGGYDERFAYWGADDMCFAAAMETLAAPVVRLSGACYHLWHPAPLDETYGHERHQEQYALSQQYHAAWGDREAMMKVRWPD